MLQIYFYLCREKEVFIGHQLHFRRKNIRRGNEEILHMKILTNYKQLSYLRKKCKQTCMVSICELCATFVY